MNINEEWRLINHPTFGTFYAVSNHGRCARVKAGVGAKAGKILKPNVIQNGYVQFYLCAPKVKPQKFLAHRLVYETFNGEIPEGRDIVHIDGNHRNNRLDNLALFTNKEPKVKEKVTRKGEIRHRKLTDEQVREIRSRFANGESMLKIAEDYPVHYATVRDVCQHRRFQDVL